MDSSPPVQIGMKGIREGLLVSLDQGTFAQIMPQLQAEVHEKHGFLEGSRIILDVGQLPLSREDLLQIQDLFAENGLELWTVLAERERTKEAARELGLATRLPGSNTDLEGNWLHTGVPEPSVTPSLAVQRSDALLLRETIRSGRSIYHEGHVVIIGDINPGAEVIATGDVVVWGRLRGLVHAGAEGDRSAIICALELAPTQLRIADKIAIPPEGRQGTPLPEMASVRGGQIVADPWRSRE